MVCGGSTWNHVTQGTLQQWWGDFKLIVLKRNSALLPQIQVASEDGELTVVSTLIPCHCFKWVIRLAVFDSSLAHFPNCVCIIKLYVFLEKSLVLPNIRFTMWRWTYRFCLLCHVSICCGHRRAPTRTASSSCAVVIQLVYQLKLTLFWLSTQNYVFYQ